MKTTWETAAPERRSRTVTSAAGEAQFLSDYPEYASTRAIDDFRTSELRRLDRQGHVYLDYTGGGLYAESQVRRHAEFLLTEVFGNPHSANPTSMAATRRVDACRQRRISLRTGCFCNPGAGELALGLTREELVSCFQRSGNSLSYEEFRHCVHHEGTGAVRVSLGLASSFADIEIFLRFAEDFLED